MAESIIVLKTDEPFDNRREDVVKELYGAAEFLGLDDVEVTAGTQTVDDRWVEGDACPECDSANLDYQNVEERRVSSIDGIANAQDVQRYHGALRVKCAECDHVIRESPVAALARSEDVPLTTADLNGEDA